MIVDGGNGPWYAGTVESDSFHDEALKKMGHPQFS
jgi:hypothetical protein